MIYHDSTETRWTLPVDTSLALIVGIFEMKVVAQLLTRII